MSISFKCSKYDNCTYFKFLVEGYFMLYVDDILVRINSKSKVDKTKVELNKEFDTKDLRATRKILGVEISRQTNLKNLYFITKKPLNSD